MLKDITIEPKTAEEKDKEFAEILIDKLITKASFNSRNDIQNSLSYLFHNSRHWQIRDIPDLHTKTFNSFMQFVKDNPPWGLGWTEKTLEAFLMPELKKIWKQVKPQIESEILKANKQGEHKGNQYAKNGKCTGTPSITKGNSRKRFIAVLKRDAPEIAKRVIAGEISAAEGMRQAGKRKPMITHSATLEGFEKAIRKKLNPKEIKQLIDLII